MSIELNNDQIYALYDLENWWNNRNEQVFEISGGPGTGKAQPDDTIIPTPTGYKKLFGRRFSFSYNPFLFSHRLGHRFTAVLRCLP